MMRYVGDAKEQHEGMECQGKEGKIRVEVAKAVQGRTGRTRPYKDKSCPSYPGGR